MFVLIPASVQPRKDEVLLFTVMDYLDGVTGPVDLRVVQHSSVAGQP